jgi:hypothetical protein
MSVPRTTRITRSSLNIVVLSDTRIQCSQSAASDKPCSVPLSILDNTVANFAPTGCTWIYHLRDHDLPSTMIDILQQSLRKTLNLYPAWTGRLHFVAFDPQEALVDHTRRHGRLWVDFGRDDTPGVRFIVARSSVSIASVLPRPIVWTNGISSLDATGLPYSKFFDDNVTLAPNDEDANAPCMIIQITMFADNAMAVTIRMAHPLADAHCLLHFVRDWAAISRDIAMNRIMSGLRPPIFDPSRLDRIAAGSIDSAVIDVALVMQSQALPMHCYDWWASGGNTCPLAMLSSTTIPAILTNVEPFSSIGPSLPWSQWDLSAPLDHNVFIFPSSVMKKLYEIVSGCDERISHLDALLAYVWRCVILSRDIRDDEDHYLDITLGLRSRLEPQLPDDFLGSPLVLAFASATGRQARLDTSLSLKILASSIRNTISKFTSQSLSALLHELAHYDDPRRRWDACLGRNHTIVTSWLRLGAERVDFGAGPPSFMEASMPSCDGCVQVMEAVRREERNDLELSEPWWMGGVSVSVHLASEVMPKFVACIVKGIVC